MKGYVLDNENNPVPSDNCWQWMEEHPYAKIVGLTRFPNGTRVSTVFLGLDHGWNGGPPVLWETMVFDSPDGSRYEDQWQERYISHNEAVAGHLAVVAALLEEFKTVQNLPSKPEEACK